MVVNGIHGNVLMRMLSVTYNTHTHTHTQAELYIDAMEMVQSQHKEQKPCGNMDRPYD